MPKLNSSDNEKFKTRLSKKIIFIAVNFLRLTSDLDNHFLNRNSENIDNISPPQNPSIEYYKIDYHSVYGNKKQSSYDCNNKDPCIRENNNNNQVIQKYNDDKTSSLKVYKYKFNIENKIDLQNQEKIKKRKNIFEIEYQGNIPQKENISGIEKQENILSIENQRNIQHKENISVIEKQVNILSIENQGDFRQQENISGHKKKENILEIENHKITGIKNLGKTCYMNSVFQCIFASKKILNFLKYDHSGEYELIKILSTILDKYEKSFEPIDLEVEINQIIDILKMPNIENCKTEGDSSEFYNIIIDTLAKDYPIKKLFFSKIENYIVCKKCEEYKKSGYEDVSSIIIRKTKDKLQTTLYYEYLNFNVSEKNFKKVKDFSCNHEKISRDKLDSVGDILVFEISNLDMNVFEFNNYISVLQKEYKLMGFIKYKNRHYISVINKNGESYHINDKIVTKVVASNPSFKLTSIVLLFYEAI
ncbi:Ubiquitin carboxyl-terminal hydrolase 7 [Dictyocoela muelleri]|nr:Ubiquitin carboxyl-terminal hydrolase 7 [Dictyocoela muelleri]